ncbi:hypothetical protein [Acidovorax sp. 56]|uniref:hypothetical protein n=1 Tax=Acidovorax sp. 56 TaxID=2035205 RepID=UPI0011787D46|nr:hypothetical protein [Acidovorax sp. 56]
MGKLLRRREREKGKERSAAMRSAPPPAHPGAICHHTTHRRRDDTATAVPRVLSWRQPRARYRGVTARGKSSRGMGKMRPGNTGREKADIDMSNRWQIKYRAISLYHKAKSTKYQPNIIQYSSLERKPFKYQKYKNQHLMAANN